MQAHLKVGGFDPKAESANRPPGPPFEGSAPADLEAERLGQGPNQPAGTPDRRRRRGAKSKGPRQRTWRPSVWAKSPISRPEPRTVEGGTGRSRRVRVSGPEGRAFCARGAKISRPEHGAGEDSAGRNRRVRVSGPGGRAFGPRAQSASRNPGSLTARGAKSKGPRKRTGRPSVWAKGLISRPEPRTVEGGTGRSRRVRVSGPEGRAFCARGAKISRPEHGAGEDSAGRNRRVRVSGPGGRAFGPRAQSASRNPGPPTAARGEVEGSA